jgi:LmbE family N-acetylglucosaminyl deacetylase
LSPRSILAAYAHPDDETTSAGALMTMYAAEGVDVHVLCATRGELGALSTGDMVVTREELPAVRESELRAVIAHYGVTDPPRFLGYRDQELADADFEEAVGRVVSEMDRVTPDVVLTFGPLGISGHTDHVAPPTG